MHNLIFRGRGRSYRELPLRFFEFGSVYRYERSGVVHGLTRVRGLTQDDSHSYVTPGAGAGRDQAPARLRARAAARLRARRLLPRAVDPRRLATSSSARTRSGRSRRRCSRRSRWTPASSSSPTRAARRSTARRSRSRPGTRSGAAGRCRPSSTTSTSRPRFGLEYQAADGTRQQPVMIHSAKFGSIERFIGVLDRALRGAFPPWLAPVQVVGIPVAGEYVDLPARGGRPAARRPAIRVEVDDSDDRMQKKIRNAQKQKVPVHADRRRRRRRPRARSRSATATARRRTGCRSRRRSARSPTPSRRACRSERSASG